MSDPRPDPGFPLKRLAWLVALKLVLLAFAIAVALRVYGLI